MEQPNEQKKETSTDLLFTPEGQAVYELNTEGELSGTYRGRFVFKTYLDPLSQLAAGRTYRDLLGPNHQEASDSERFISFALSQLKYRIVKAPPFWKSDGMIDGNLADLNVISLILDKAIQAEILYKEELKKRKEEALEKASKAAQALHESLNPKKEEKNE